MVEAAPLPPLAAGASGEQRAVQYAAVLERLELLLQGEHDWVAAMATVACELHAAFAYFHWTGFYRAAAATPAAAQHAEHAQHEQRPSEQQLVIGPYQGGLGCLRIPFSKGVCGAAARERRTQLVPDVHAFPGHIACASSTQSEVVVPVVTPDGRLLAVLDVDSDLPAAFTEVDAEWMERLCNLLGARSWQTGL